MQINQRGAVRLKNLANLPESKKVFTHYSAFDKLIINYIRFTVVLCIGELFIGRLCPNTDRH